MARSRRERPSRLGPNLRKLRAASGKTLRDIEEKSGLTNGYLSQLERGDVGHPSPTVLRKLAKGYDVDFRVLLAWAGYIEEDQLALTPNQAVALSTIGDPSTEELRAFQEVWQLLQRNRTATSMESPLLAPDLDAVARQEVAGYARALLVEAEAFGKRPTPLPTLQAAAELIRADELELTPADRVALSRRLGRWVDNGWRRLRGAFDFRTRSIWIKPELHRKQERFTLAHEIGHAILPAHKELFAYVDTPAQLNADVRALLEREANFAAAQLLFQCGELTDEADSSFQTLGLICDLADTFGASIVATAREIAETSHREVAVAIGHQPKSFMGPTNLFTSEPFAKRFRWREGLAPHSLIRQALSSARSEVNADEWVVNDVRDKRTHLRIETLHTGYAALALIVKDPALKRATRNLILAR